LACVLIDSERVLDLCASRRIDAAAFYDPVRRRLFQVASEMHQRRVAVDLTTLSARLKDLGELDDLGGEAFLQGLIERVPTAESATYYLDILQQKYLLRELFWCSQRIAERCLRSGRQDAWEVLGQAEESLFEIRNLDRRTLSSWAGHIDHASEEIARLISRPSGRLTGLSTGFPSLDKVLFGLHDGEMIVLAARPSMGKTSLAMNIAESVATGYNPVSGYGAEDRQGRSVAVFSLEMSAGAIVRRMLCSRAGVSWSRVVERLCTSDDSRRLVRAANELKQVRMFVDDTAGLDIMELRARARRLKRSHDIGLVVVDYLQLLQHRDVDPNNQQLMIQRISGMLKAMAKELRVPVLVLSQLNRQPETRDRSGVPKLSDLRDSGSIEQDADVVMLLRLPARNKLGNDPQRKRAETIPGLAIVDIAKHRNGRTGEVAMLFEEEYTRFSELAPEHADSGRGIQPSEGGFD